MLDKICMESAFIKGPYVKQFEQDFIMANTAKYGVGCSNGTSAISLALECLDIVSGDEVILPSHTFIATAEAVCHVGAIPVFADIKPDDYTIDVVDIRKKITSKTRAIIPVHIYGTPCDMDDIIAVAEEYDLRVIEDCAQAHFAKYKGQYVGTFGDAGTFSFYPGKNLGAYGDAGFILCKTMEVEEKLRRLVDHGRLSKYDHDIVGYNNRLDAMQAGILSIKLKYIHQWNQKRQKIAYIYNDNFRKKGIKTIEHVVYKDPVYHVYNLEIDMRDNLREHLLGLQIQTGIHYPEPIHKTTAFSKYNNICLPITERISDKIISLPIYPEMSDSEVEFVVNSLLSY